MPSRLVRNLGSRSDLKSDLLRLGAQYGPEEQRWCAGEEVPQENSCHAPSQDTHNSYSSTHKNSHTPQVERRQRERQSVASFCCLFLLPLFVASFSCLFLSLLSLASFYCLCLLPLSIASFCCLFLLLLSLAMPTHAIPQEEGGGR